MRYLTMDRPLTVAIAGCGSRGQDTYTRILLDMPEKASKEGRIRAIGLSGFRTDQIQEVTDKGEIRTMIMKWNSGKPLERNLFCRRFAYTLRFHKKCSVTAIKEGRP